MRGVSGDRSRPTFSIVTVCRNADRSIRKTVESVLHQVGFEGQTEHIVIDGVSTDGTLDTLATYPHLRVVSEPDAGIYDAMNKGIALARGDYIGILNADDWYEPDALLSVARTFAQWPDAAVVHGDIRRWDGAAALDDVKPPLERGLGGPLAMRVHHPACFVKKDVFSRVGGFDLSFPVFADYHWVCRVVSAGAELRYCPKVLTNFRLGGVSTMRFAIAERYRVFRAGGSGRLAAAATVAYSCGVVLRNRFRG